MFKRKINYKMKQRVVKGRKREMEGERDRKKEKEREIKSD